MNRFLEWQLARIIFAGEELTFTSNSTSFVGDKPAFAGSSTKFAGGIWIHYQWHGYDQCQYHQRSSVHSYLLIIYFSQSGL
jgi:hypothetical protein